MPGDTSPSLDPVAARDVAAQLAAYDVLWLEEPLAGTDLRGLAALRASAPGIRIAGGEMTRTFAETLAALDADAFDVYQPDVVLAGGMLRTRTVAELALARNRWFTPHTWTNGLGLLANLHVAAGVGGGPFIEYPYDPPGWTPGAPRRLPGRAHPPRPRRRPARAVGARPGCRAGRGRHREVRGMSGSTAPAPDRDRPTAADWLARAAAVTPRNEAFIDGRFVPAASGATFPDIAGRDGGRITDVAQGDVEDVGRAVKAARTSFDDRRWADQSPANRKRILLKLADLIRANRDELALLESLDVGKPIRDTLAVDVPSAAKTIQWYAETIDKVYGEVGPTGPGCPVARDPRADRGGRRDRALELPADRHRLEARRGPRDRQLGRAQAGVAVAADRPAPRGARGRSRPAGRRPQRRPGPGCRHRGCARPPPGGRQDRVHGLHRGRAVAAARRRRDGRQGHHPRARREEPAGRARRRRRSRSRGRHHRDGDLLQQRPVL